MRALLALTLLVACADSPDAPDVTTTEHALGLTRTPLGGDVFHYDFAIRVGNGPNGALHVHRVVRESSPGHPRPTSNAIMLMHGDFATFGSNFLPGNAGLARWLAQRDIDVWGIDRRWARTPAGEVDVSDFASMGVSEELDDIGSALAFARATRAITSGSLDRMVLSGFSRGGMLAYFYTSREATRPPAFRHVKGLVPLDVYAAIAPADEDIRLFNCELAVAEQEFYDAGFIDLPNTFQIEIGQLFLTAPNDPAPDPFRPGQTNRDKMLAFVGRTYRLGFPATPVYHLIAPTIDTVVTGLRYTPEATVGHWLADAPPHQSTLEQAETDGIVCGDAPVIDVPLSRIRVPLFLIAAAGGYGEYAVYSTTQVSSTDVSSLVVRRLPVEREEEDFGHADILYATDAPALVWQHLRAWLEHH